MAHYLVGSGITWDSITAVVVDVLGFEQEVRGDGQHGAPLRLR